MRLLKAPSMCRLSVCNARPGVIDGLIAGFNLSRGAVLSTLPYQVCKRHKSVQPLIRYFDVTPQQEDIPPFIASFFPTSPSKIGPGHLISKLPHCKVTSESIPIALFLVTPSMMRLFDKDDEFLRSAMRQIFHMKAEPAETTTNSYDAIVAVVDRLPVIEARVQEQVTNFSGLLDKGREGLALMVGHSQKIAPDLWKPRPEKYHVDTMNIQQKSTISFELYPKSQCGKILRKLENLGLQEFYASRTFEVPLANTIFRNGQTSTMYISRWAKESAEQGFNLIKKAKIRNQHVMMALGYSRGRMAFSIPRTLITMPRQVATAVGNIIRQFYVTDSASETVPASAELEKAITNISETAGPEKSGVAVWALVTPRGRWTTEPTLASKTLRHSLEGGSRIHRVLSGGGGWGQKQGLLSLDPDTAYHVEGSPEMQLYGDGESFNLERKEALGEVVKPGDLVQFFTFPPHLLRNQDLGRKSHLSANQVANTHGYALMKAQKSRLVLEFGTIPSTIDDMPELNHPDTDADAFHEVEVAVNHFGALSEQGISMSINTFDQEKSAFIGAQRTGQVVQTKVDVPYSKFNYTDVPVGAADTKRKFAKSNGSPVRQSSSKENAMGQRQSTPAWPRATPKGGQEQMSVSAAVASNEDDLERLKQERLRALSERFEHG